MEQTKVDIIADEFGNIICQSSINSEFGHVNLQQVRDISIAVGCVQKSTLKTSLFGKLEDLKSIGLESFKSLPGKILIKESLESFNEKNPDRDLKYAGDTGIICCNDGQPIYRKTFYVNETSTEDELVEVYNITEIEHAINEHFMHLVLCGNFQPLLNACIKLLVSNIKSQLILFYAGLAAQELGVNTAKIFYKEALDLPDAVDLYGGGPTRLLILNNLSNLLFDLEEYEECKTNCQEFIRQSESYNNSSPIHQYIVNNHYLFAASVVNLHRNLDFINDYSMHNMNGKLKKFSVINELISAKKGILTAIELTPITKGNDYFLSDYNDVLNKLNKLIIIMTT
jgi:hypothetical protein